MVSPKFSIITVTWNNLNGLRETLSSIEAQVYRGFEWIMVDGGSVDGSLDCARDSSIEEKKILSGSDSGIYDAMNRGIREVSESSDYVIFLNAGDKFDNESVLGNVARWLKGQGTALPDVIYGGAKEVNRFGIRVKKGRPLWYLHFGMVAHHQAMFFERKCIANYKYRLEYSIAADYGLVCELKATGASFRRTPLSICVFGSPGASLRRAAEGRKEAALIRTKFLKSSPLLSWIGYFANRLSFAVKRAIRYY